MRTAIVSPIKQCRFKETTAKANFGWGDIDRITGTVIATMIWH